jgi:hypothetical protein
MSDISDERLAELAEIYGVHGGQIALVIRELQRRRATPPDADGERYRWLRDHAEKAVQMGVGEFWSIRVDPLRGPIFDAAIDAARAKGEG